MNVIYRIARTLFGQGDAGLKVKGRYVVEHLDKHGNLKGKYEIPNGVTDSGKNAILDSFFRNQTQPSLWYLGIIDNSGFTAVANTDTTGAHGGWNEFQTYNEATRPQWVVGASASQAITNPSPAVFNITGSGLLKGIFAASVNTKGGATGTLWATALFPTTVTVSNADQLKITYTVSITA